MKKDRYLIIYFLTLTFFLTSVLTCKVEVNEIPITSNSKKAVQQFLEGRELIEKSQIAKALEKFDEALQYDPDFAMAYLYKSINIGDYNKRIANIEKALKQLDNISDGEKNMILAYKAFYDGNEGLMWDYLNNLLELYPKDKRVNYLAGYLNYNRQKYDDALGHYNNSLVIDAQFPPAVNMLGYTFMKLEKYEEAEKYFKYFMQLLPENPRPYDSYADLLLESERYDESITYYQKSLEMDTSFYYPIRKIGNIYILKKDYNEARRYFQQYFDVATQLNSKFLALYNIANTYLYENDTENALNIYESYKNLAIENNTPFNEILGTVYQGYIYACCGNIEKGLEYYEIALKQNESAELTEEQRFNLKMNILTWTSQAYIDLNDFEKSSIELKKCSEMATKLDNSYIRNWINVFYAYSEIKQSNYEAAIDILDQVYIKNPLINYYYALVYELKGDDEQAKKFYRNVINEKQSGIDLALFYTKAEAKLTNKFTGIN